MTISRTRFAFQATARPLTAVFGLGSLLFLSDCHVCSCQAVPKAPGQSSAVEANASAGPKGDGTAPPVAYNWKSVTMLGGGFVTGIIFSPIEKDLIYARTDVGGAYRYNPVDKTWIGITDMFGRADSNLLGIESIAVDPVNANRVYAAVGTYVQSWAGNGAILRSDDRGNTWKRVDMSIKMGGNEYGRSNGERLAVDPNEPKVLFFGSRKDGLWKSADAGESFKKSDFPVPDDAKGFGIVWITFDKSSGTKGKPTPTLYAGTANNDGSLYRSTDAGKTWALVPKQPPGMMSSHAAFDSAGNLYLSYGNGPGPGEETTGGVYRYEPKKGTFTNISPVAPSGDDKFGYGGLAVDAAHPGTLMVTTIDRWTKGDDIFRTADGGKTWRAIHGKAVRDDAGAKYLYWGRDKPSANGWMGYISMDPFNNAHAMYVTGQGLWATDDANLADTDKPTHWKFLDKGLEECVIADFVSPPVGPPLLSVLGDLGGFRHDDLNVSPSRGMFDNPIFGSGTGIDFAEKKPEIVVRVGRGDKGNGASSVDQGATWTKFPTEPKGKASGAVAVSADGTTFLWAPKEGPAAYSKDKGATWTRAAGLPDPAKIPDWAPVNLRIASDRVNPLKFYAYDVLAGTGYISTDAAVHFTEIPVGLPALPEYALMGGSIHAAPGVEGDVWLTTGKEVYRSTDSGKTYDAVPGAVESYSLGFGKAAAGKKFPAVYLSGKVGEVTGVFRSDDAGQTWARVNDDQHQYGGAGIVNGDPRVYGRVYVGTGGRGILYGEPK